MSSINAKIDYSDLQTEMITLLKMQTHIQKEINRVQSIMDTIRKKFDPLAPKLRANTPEEKK